MAMLTALVAFCIALCLLNLVLIWGIIRRLRDHTKRLSNHSDPAGPIVAPAGSKVGAFVAATIDGQTVAPTTLTGPTLFAFMSPNCSACRERLPDFLAAATRWPGGAGSIVVTLAGEADEVAGLQREVSAIAKVVIEADNGPLQKAFAVTGYPAFAVVDEAGVVVGSGYDLNDLPLPAAQ